MGAGLGLCLGLGLGLSAGVRLGVANPNPKLGGEGGLLGLHPLPDALLVQSVGGGRAAAERILER